MIAKLFLSFKKSPLLAFIKFEPTFLTGSLAVYLSVPVPAYSSGRQGEAGGRGVWGEFRPPSPVSSVRIFSNRHRNTRQLDGEPYILGRAEFRQTYRLDASMEQATRALSALRQQIASDARFPKTTGNE